MLQLLQEEAFLKNIKFIWVGCTGREQAQVTQHSVTSQHLQELIALQQSNSEQQYTQHISKGHLKAPK